MMDMFKGKYFKHQSCDDSIFVLSRYEREYNLPDSMKFVFKSITTDMYFSGFVDAKMAPSVKYSIMTYLLTETGHGFQSPLWKVLNGEEI